MPWKTVSPVQKAPDQSPHAGHHLERVLVAGVEAEGLREELHGRPGVSPPRLEVGPSVQQHRVLGVLLRGGCE